MNILFLTRSLPPHGSGGLERHGAYLIDYLRRYDQVTVITTAHPGGIDEEDGIIYLPGTTPGKYYLGWRRRLARKLKTLLPRRDFDIIISESIALYPFYLSGLSSSFDIPAICIIHGTVEKELRTLLRRRLSFRLPLSFAYKIYMDYLVDRRCYPLVDGFVAISSEIGRIIRNKYPEARVETVYNGIDTKLFAPGGGSGGLKREWGIGEQDTVLLCVGRLMEEKGIDEVIDALPGLLKRHPFLKFIWVGDGDYRRAAQKRINKLGMDGTVRLPGDLEYERLPDAYRLSDIFVFPSRRDEGLPLVLLEASSCGLPVVAARSAVTGEIFTDGTDGILYDRGAEGDLERKLGRLLSKEGRIDYIGKNARKMAAGRFSLETMGERTRGFALEIKSGRTR